MADLKDNATYETSETKLVSEKFTESVCWLFLSDKKSKLYTMALVIRDSLHKGGRIRRLLEEYVIESKVFDFKMYSIIKIYWRGSAKVIIRFKKIVIDIKLKKLKEYELAGKIFSSVSDFYRGRNYLH